MPVSYNWFITNENLLDFESSMQKKISNVVSVCLFGAVCNLDILLMAQYFTIFYYCVFQNAATQESYQQTNQQRNHQRNPQNLQFPANKIDKTSYFMTQQMRMVSVSKKYSMYSGTTTPPFF